MNTNIMDEEDIENYYQAKIQILEQCSRICIQILEHQLHSAANKRDEYKMQLDAANKENIIQKKIIRDLIMIAEDFWNSKECIEPKDKQTQYNKLLDIKKNAV
jgi:hypothetical protein